MQLTTKLAIDKFVEKLNHIDFGPIAFKLMNPDEGSGWTLDRTTEAIEGYRRFLLLSYLYPDRKIVPDRIVDRVWHTHILDTEKYRADCQEVFGKFIDHYPYFGTIDAADRQDLEAAFAETCQLLDRHFS
jgi:hypothetical protein